MPQNSSKRFRLFATAFVLAAVALASCSAQSPPVVLATAADPAQNADVPASAATERRTGEESTRRVPEAVESPADVNEVAAAVPAEAGALPTETDATPANVTDKPDNVKVAPRPAAAEARPVTAEAKPVAAAAKPVEPAVVEVAQLPPSALLAVGAPTFAFSADDAGRLIGGYFSAPRPIVASPIESPAEERPWPRSAESPPHDVIPPAEYSAARVIPLERVVLVSLRPAVDLPPLGVELVISTPERPSLPLAPKTAIAGPDPRQLADLPQLGRMDEGVVSLVDDATAVPLLQALLSPLGSMRSGGVPFVPPVLLDPLAHTHDFELKDPPADNDPPARPTAPLPAPVLP
jgi:hypothetical protein